MTAKHNEDFKISAHAEKISVEGALNVYNLHRAKKQLKIYLKKVRVIDFSGLSGLDTAAAIMLRRLSGKTNISFENLDKKYQPLFDLIKDAAVKPLAKKHKMPAWFSGIVHVGKAAVKAKKSSYDIIAFFGRACISLVNIVLNPSHLRFGSIIHHIEEIGIKAVPIVSLIAFLISIVLAYQSIAQLKPLGAEQFTVDLIAISVLREMGVLLTAIMVAGRSGSAFTAEIGVMKINEEIDALKTIGIDPFEMLVIPRLIAIIIALPLLTFIADLMGLAGGAVLSKILIGISFQEYIDKVQHVVTLKTFVVGMIKAPVFALAIGVVGCLHGMNVSGSSESVGEETTSSVVKSIFIVLLLDAMFSILFEQLGI